MNSIIENAYAKYLRYNQEIRDLEYKTRKSYEHNELEGRGSLWPSDVGKCHRAAIQRSRNAPGHSTFNTRGLDYMNTGSYTETETLKALKHVYAGRVTEQVVLKYQMWSGKVDFGIDIGTESPILIEHKTTSEKQFDSDANTELPKHEHVGQSVTYMWLYEKIYGITPMVLIFYKTWGNFAEFHLERVDRTIQLTSNINDIINVKNYDYDVYGEIEKLMEAYDQPVLPDRLDKKYKGCEFMGKPSCQFYNNCWGDE